MLNLPSKLTSFRPHCNEQSLSIENVTGRSFRLNESLFERMMSPKTPGASGIPTSSLTVQRRMHPEIADLVRTTLYPELKVCKNAAFFKPNPNEVSGS